MFYLVTLLGAPFAHPTEMSDDLLDYNYFQSRTLSTQNKTHTSHGHMLTFQYVGITKVNNSV